MLIIRLAEREYEVANNFAECELLADEWALFLRKSFLAAL